MEVFPMHLLIAVCLCGISSPCYGQSTCTEDSPVTLTFYAAPRNNRLNCRRPFHGEGATYSWKWYDPSRYLYFPIADHENVTVTDNGAALIFSYTPGNTGFMCEIHKANNEPTGPIEYNVIQSQLIQTNQGDDYVTYMVRDYSFISIPCTVAGTFVGDDILFVWYKTLDDDEIFIYDSNRIYVDNEGNLNFSPVLMSDDIWNESRYWYKCVVNSTKLGIRLVGPSFKFNVYDAGPDRISTQPTLKYASRNVQARVNDSIVLECVFSNDGHSDLTYKWYRPADEEVVFGIYVYTSKQRLFIDHVQSDHNGYWYCAASNSDFSSIKHGIHVTVTC